MNYDAVLPCGPMRIVFYPQQDRIGHRIELLIDGRFTPVLQSHEGHEHDTWPCSPALQTVHTESRLEGQVALLVGMAGTSHWSASVTADISRGQATFDIACRVTGQPQWLGSTYRWLEPRGKRPRQPVHIEPLAPTAVHWNADGLGVVLRAPCEATGSERTIRWGYVVTAADL